MEQWKEVVGHEGLYEVSDHGRIRRRGKSRNGYPDGRILEQNLAYSVDNRYRRVLLCSHGTNERQSVHALVATAFLGARPHGHEINHKNGDKRDNRVSNLEWVTRKENQRHSWDVLGRLVARGEQNGSSKLSVNQVRAIRKRYESGSVSQAKLAVQYGISQHQISRIVRRQNWQHVA